MAPTCKTSAPSPRLVRSAANSLPRGGTETEAVTLIAASAQVEHVDPQSLFGLPPLSVAEVAIYLSVGEDVVRDRIREKKLRAAKIGGRYRIRPADIAEYLMTQFEKN